MVSTGWGTHFTFVKIKAWLFAIVSMAERAKQTPQAIRTTLKSLKNKWVNFAVTSGEHTKSYPFARAKPEGRPRAIKPAKASPTE